MRDTVASYFKIPIFKLLFSVPDGKLREELHHEYKRGGCSVRAVRIVTKTNSSGRVAIITFSDPADVSKALEDSRNKRVFGSLIEADKLNNQPDDRWDIDIKYSDADPVFLTIIRIRPLIGYVRYLHKNSVMQLRIRMFLNLDPDQVPDWVLTVQNEGIIILEQHFVTLSYKDIIRILADKYVFLNSILVQKH